MQSQNRHLPNVVRKPEGYVGSFRSSLEVADAGDRAPLGRDSLAVSILDKGLVAETTQIGFT